MAADGRIEARAAGETGRRRIAEEGDPGGGVGSGGVGEGDDVGQFEEWRDGDEGGAAPHGGQGPGAPPAARSVAAPELRALLQRVADPLGRDALSARAQARLDGWAVIPGGEEDGFAGLEPGRTFWGPHTGPLGYRREDAQPAGAARPPFP
jgi:hypothetical protein